MKRKRKTLSNQIRDAIENAEVTRYRIARETGVSEAQLSRFVRGLARLNLDSVDRVAEYLGLEITIRKPAERK